MKTKKEIISQYLDLESLGESTRRIIESCMKEYADQAIEKIKTFEEFYDCLPYGLVKVDEINKVQSLL